MAALLHLPVDTALLLTGSCVAFIGCASAVLFYALMLRRGGSRHRSGRTSHANRAAAAAAAAGLDPVAAGIAIEELRDRSYFGLDCRWQATAAATVGRSHRWRQQLAQRTRPSWRLPAILELAEASAVIVPELPSLAPSAAGAGKAARGAPSRRVRRRLDRRRRRLLLRMRPAAVAGVRKPAGRLRRSRRPLPKPQTLSRIMEALVSNQSGLRYAAGDRESAATAVVAVSAPPGSKSTPPPTACSGDAADAAAAAAVPLSPPPRPQSRTSRVGCSGGQRLQFALRLASRECKIRAAQLSFTDSED